MTLQCDPCRKGYYKDTAGTDNCQQCEEGFTTEGNGTNNSQGCSVSKSLVVSIVRHYNHTQLAFKTTLFDWSSLPF